MGKREPTTKAGKPRHGGMSGKSHHPAMRHRSKAKKQRAFENARVLREFRKLKKVQVPSSADQARTSSAPPGSASPEHEMPAAARGRRGWAMEEGHQPAESSKPAARPAAKKPNPFNAARRSVDAERRAREERQEARKARAAALEEAKRQRKAQHKQLTKRSRTGQLKLGSHAKLLLSRIQSQMADNSA